MRAPLAPALLALIALALPLSFACAKPIAATDAPALTCAKAGQQCVYAGGKIGLCTASGGECDGSPCLVCMSLH